MLTLICLSYLLGIICFTQRWSGRSIYLLPAAASAVLFFIDLGLVEIPKSFLSEWHFDRSIQLAIELSPPVLGKWLSLLVNSIGTAVYVFSFFYLTKRKDSHRIAGFLMIFQASMLGILLSDNLFGLFIFWELTSVSSYFLIGTNNRESSSRASALQALLITGLGGLAMLVGIVIFQQAHGIVRISELLAIKEFSHFGILGQTASFLILLGAITKSAQVPFHFWLPNAMVAPTPISAFLHSATMVKAGVYLVAVLSPALRWMPGWQPSIYVFGALTLVCGTILSFGTSDLKRILAHTTIATLGALLLLIAIGTPAALKAFVLLLTAHAFYKAAAFFLAADIEKTAGTRDLKLLSGLIKLAPLSAVGGFLVMFAFAGIGPFLSFTAKETLLADLLAMRNPMDSFSLIAFSMYTAGGVAVAFNLGARVYLGAPSAAVSGAKGDLAKPAIISMLALAGLAIPVLYSTILENIISGFTQSYGFQIDASIVLWMGFHKEFFLSLGLIALGFAIFMRWPEVNSILERVLGSFWRASGDRLYSGFLEKLMALANLQTKIQQPGSLKFYFMVVIATFLGLTAIPAIDLARRIGLAQFSGFDLEWLILVIAILSTWKTLTTNSQFAAVLSLGLVGFCVAQFFMIFGAPDLAMTQMLVELLTVILFVFVFFHLPNIHLFDSKREKGFSLLVSAFVGILFFTLTYVSLEYKGFQPISEYFARSSYDLAYGKNIVNVILVDFRGLDTLGEITVLAIAGLGVYVLFQSQARRPS
ncbi:MAG: hypothetical protein COT74_11710 [Bdellovibrionales bacterium CG10_big_fil_rev_8_21_14_0_10_45_34]|nr:MAG: hypothetical protein COT74_11710 [Bdellovibrionales bacterium CG10_big_fil_rev_8_21_14_0_10_45_34]